MCQIKVVNNCMGYKTVSFNVLLIFSVTKNRKNVSDTGCNFDIFDNFPVMH